MNLPNHDHPPISATKTKRPPPTLPQQDSSKCKSSTLPDPDTYSIRTATPADIHFIDHLQKKYADYLGFIHRAALLHKLGEGCFLLMKVNGEEAAFCYHTHGIASPFHIFQHGVDEQLWRAGYGTVLLAAACNLARQSNFKYVNLNVRDNLPANQFWRALGAKLIDVVPGGKSRGRMLNRYTILPDRTRTLAALRPSACPDQGGFLKSPDLRTGYLFSGTLEANLVRAFPDKSSKQPHSTPEPLISSPGQSLVKKSPLRRQNPRFQKSTRNPDRLLTWPAPCR